ncbi:MAG: DNA polymerase III subunit alpha [Alphaproteobacteria bacterium]|nr:DNA polymerase III subunit alpha [Alphaproteobacteria bacterium]
MSDLEFIHLRVHSAYTLSQGALTTKNLIDLTLHHAMPAVGVTDIGNLFGAFEFCLYAQEAGIQPIIGCQLAITNEDNHIKTNNASHITLLPDYLVLFVKNKIGYQNLIQLVSNSFLNNKEETDPQIKLSDLAHYNEGLIALTGGSKGLISRYIKNNQIDAALAKLKFLQEIFPKHLYVELMRHGLQDEIVTEEHLINFAYDLNLPLVATNEVFFSDPSFYEAHDALLCISEGTYINDANRYRVTENNYFKSKAEMNQLFSDLPESIENTINIAKRCSFIIEPSQPILPKFNSGQNIKEDEFLYQKARQGLEERLTNKNFYLSTLNKNELDSKKIYQERLEYELDVITKMGFAGYFLIVSDFIQWAKSQNIPVGPGRGSGAGSVVAWALTITDLDPLRWGLLFERFLNPERVSMPDFDIDFCQNRRDEVIRYVQDKYGKDCVAQIITFGKLQARAVLRDVGRVLQLPFGLIDRLCKLIPYNPANPLTLHEAITQEPEFKQAQETDANVHKLISIALKLEGLYRHASTHAAGVVIADRSLYQLVPLYRDPRSDMPVTQFNMKYIEQTGLIKFDFLGLKTLTVLALVLEMIKDRGIDLDLTNIPMDDQLTFSLLGEGETMGVFQLESSGMRDVLRRLKPDRFEDIIAVVALYRPGPMDNIPRYISCKHGLEKPDYLHKSLETILKETHGIIIYQEQVMQIAQILSGFSLAKADILRRAMGKKNKAEMAAQRKEFIEGAAHNNIAKDKADLIFEQVNKFAGYGFNKSHAAAYALISYQTAWLKANYPLEFIAASMTYEIGNTDKLNSFRQELSRLNFKLLPPDVNHSFSNFKVEQTDQGFAIRYALAAIKNVGVGVMEELVNIREEVGIFKDLNDFISRLGNKIPNKRQLESLICAGAFDNLNHNRKQLFDHVDLILKQAQTQSRLDQNQSNQSLLFNNFDQSQVSNLHLPECADWPSIERLNKEFDVIGFYLSTHPLDDFSSSLTRFEIVTSTSLQTEKLENKIKMAGIVISKQERRSAKGNRFAFIQFSDAAGMYEALAFSDILSRFRELLEPGKLVLLTMDVRYENDEARLTINNVQALDKLINEMVTDYRITVSNEQAIQSLKEFLSNEPAGKNKIYILFEEKTRQQKIQIVLDQCWFLSIAARNSIREIPGIISLEEIGK